MHQPQQQPHSRFGAATSPSRHSFAFVAEVDVN
jgi:hypothetical protein